ncbi:hypothetical protein AVEN_191665-1 [Araneus ventricosus]|uniref:Uncharacterized protein n=1 Tax=Araneus ventricosus TaxID=182803 RepID=A0A4Y1ZKN4_ARAVE|nr:hypothetical protein AVEN_191665-1 [Araneus ventricosus]
MGRRLSVAPMASTGAAALMVAGHEGNVLWSPILRHLNGTVLSWLQTEIWGGILSVAPSHQLAAAVVAGTAGSVLLSIFPRPKHHLNGAVTMWLRNRDMGRHTNQRMN